MKFLFKLVQYYLYKPMIDVLYTSFYLESIRSGRAENLNTKDQEKLIHVPTQTDENQNEDTSITTVLCRIPTASEWLHYDTIFYILGRFNYKIASAYKGVFFLS